MHLQGTLTTTTNYTNVRCSSDTVLSGDDLGQVGQVRIRGALIAASAPMYPEDCGEAFPGILFIGNSTLLIVLGFEPQSYGRVEHQLAS